MAKKFVRSFLIPAVLSLTMCLVLTACSIGGGGTIGNATRPPDNSHTHTYTKAETIARIEACIAAGAVNALDEYTASAPTCTRPGEYYTSCSCGRIGNEVFSYGSARGHDFGEWIEEIAANCTKDGTRGHYYCRICEKTLM